MRSPDRAMRRQAALALDDSLSAYAGDLDEHCENLVRCRRRFASRNGSGQLCRPGGAAAG
jgi:hypothetical protein